LKIARVGEVDHRVEQGDRVDPVVAHLVEVGGRHQGERAAQAEPDQVDLAAAGDVLDDVHRRAGAADEVVIHGGVGHRRVGVAVADREDRALVAHRPLDEAALRGEVHHVVLVDPGRAAQQRHVVDLAGLRLVLQDLDEVAAVDHLRRGGGEVAADLERRHVDLARPAVVVQHVVDEVAGAVGEAATAGVQRLLEHRRVGDREVRRRERVGDEAQRQLRLAGLHRVEVGDAQQVQAVLAGGEVRLAQRPERGVALPGGVEEPLVLRVDRHRAVRRLPGEAVERRRTGGQQSFAEAERQGHVLQRVFGRGLDRGAERLAEQRGVVVGEQRRLRGERRRGGR